MGEKVREREGKRGRGREKDTEQKTVGISGAVNNLQRTK